MVPQNCSVSHILQNIFLCVQQNRHSYRFGTTWGWVNDERIFISEWTIPLRPACLNVILTKICSCLRTEEHEVSVMWVWISSCRTVIRSWMTRRVTAAILWTDTCCVTPVTSNTSTLPPRRLQQTATTVSFKHLLPPSGCSETSPFAKDPQLLHCQKSQLRLRLQTVWDTLLLLLLYIVLCLNYLPYCFFFLFWDLHLLLFY